MLKWEHFRYNYIFHVLQTINSISLHGYIVVLFNKSIVLERAKWCIKIDNSGEIDTIYSAGYISHCHQRV